MRTKLTALFFLLAAGLATAGAFPEGKTCAVSYTFDDGLADHYTVAYPMFKAAGLKATFFIIGSKVGDPSGLRNKAEPNTPLMTWDEIKEMADGGMEIASHGWAHAKYAKMDRDAILADIRTNQAAILAHVGRPCVSFAAPYNAKKGADDSDVEALAKEAGLTAMRTHQKGAGGAMTAERMNAIVDAAARRGEWVVFMLHGLTRGYDAWADLDELRQHLEWVKSRPDVWVGTFGEVAAAQTAGATLARDVAFLTAHAPTGDLPLPGDFVTNNCLLAAQARATAIESYPDEIYLDYVLPYSVIREERDDWRQEFRDRFLPLIAGCTNAYDAAVTLDRKIWDLLGVHYNVKRDRARQSPRHSMRIGMASCTGISIILIDVCRALGIPARLVGCCWTTIPGNHSWVEVWSNGAWHVVASGEKEREDNIWFLEYAALADASRPDRRIYASRWSPGETHFWQTWEWPGCVSDVPADDVTANYRTRPVFAIVVSPETAADPNWKGVAEALAEKHRDVAWPVVFTVAPTNALESLRAVQPSRVAFVMQPDEVGEPAYRTIKRLMRQLDDDPFDDALYGIVTGPDAATALRIARSREPQKLERVLATTGVEPDVVPGPVVVISDAFPKGEYWEKQADGTVARHATTNATSPVFADAWRRLDPDLLLTSSHATERNLEMPFSQGAIVSKGGRFWATSWPLTAGGDEVELAAPEREKVWLAAGNCLIANHVANDDMVMTALSFGKVNQFVGYFKPTWFGFVGWTTWSNFAGGEMSLVESYFDANAQLLRKLEAGDWKDEREKAGLEWDRDATIFYGDPMLDIRCGRRRLVSRGSRPRPIGR